MVPNWSQANGVDIWYGMVQFKWEAEISNLSLYRQTVMQTSDQ